MPPFVESRMRGVRLHDGGQVPPEIRGVAAVVRLHVKRHLQVEVGGFAWKFQKKIIGAKVFLNVGTKINW